MRSAYSEEMPGPNTLGEYLRARRELVDPATVGLRVAGVRRTPGLRREEVATLAGISADYYLRLEQGRDRHPSPPVLESLARVFGLDPTATSYLLSLAVFMPVSGWIADRWGARTVFCTAIAIFTVGSALAGLSNSLGMMVAMRALQGLGGAMMTPVGRLILLRTFPRDRIVTAMMYMSIPAMIGPTMGPVVGGFLATYASWRWIFYVNIPIGLVGILLVRRFIDEHREPPPARARCRT